MKLSDLVNFREMLDQISVEDIQTPVDLEIKKIKQLVDSNQASSSKIEQTHTNLIQNFQQLINNVDEIRHELQKQIDQEERFWFQESYRLFEEEMRNEHHDYILNRRPQLKPQPILLGRLRMYSNWKFPGMIIRPGLETFAGEMVAFDPLYMVDTSMDLLRKVVDINGFTPEYQARVRSIVIDERLEHEILEKIPNNQFGLCLAYNFFNFRPLEYVKKYLQEIYQKLRPGGVLIMTINDCDRPPGVRSAESHYACYTPGHLVMQLAENIGYDRSYTWHDNGPITFIELRKPGELTSLRGGQTLAKIIPK